jgi:2-methylisocitrate lyase-like PEP mutase family enzyme
MSLLTEGPQPVTAPLVLNPLMARMAEPAAFGAGYLGGGATGYPAPATVDTDKLLPSSVRRSRSEGLTP